MVDFQISLAAARVNAKKTQKEVARHFHVSEQTIVAWENGKSKPDVDQGRELARFYGIPLDYIFFGSKSN